MDGRLPAEIQLSLDRQSFLEDERGHRSLDKWLDASQGTYPDGLTDDYDSSSGLERLTNLFE